MIGLDTNIVVRYLAQDEPRQSRAAARLIESLTEENPGVLTFISLAEVVWVMEDSYGAGRDDIVRIVEDLLQTRTLMVQHADIAWRALARYRTGAADFADYLIERMSTEMGCSATFTLDKKAARDDCGMSLLVG